MNASARLRKRSVLIVASSVILLLFVLFRWHAITFNDDIMVDESMFLVDAMRANDAGYTPWLRYDNLTSGPLNSLPLALLLKLGFPANHILLHSFAAVLQACAFVLLLLVAVKLAGLAPGVAIGLGGALIFALQQAPDFSHYSSGLVPFVLLVAGWWSAVRVNQTGLIATNLPRLFFAFLLFGMAPLAKTQAVVPGLVCCLGVAALFLWQECGKHGRLSQLVAGFCVMFLGGALPLSIAFWSVWQSGAMEYAIGSIEAVGGYAGQIDIVKTLKDVVFLVLSADSRFLFAAATASGVVLVFERKASTECETDVSFATGEMILLFAMAAWLAAALFAAAVPQTMAAIYEVFLYAPALLLVAALAGFLRQARPKCYSSSVVIVVGCFIAASFPLLGPALRKNFASSGKSHSSLPMDAEHQVSGVLRELKQDGDELFVWGWAPAIYIHAGMTPASRFSQAHLCTERFYPGSLFRDALMEDLSQSKPRFIVDAMQSGFGMNQLGTWIGFYEPSRDLSAQDFYPKLVEMGYSMVADVLLKDGSKAVIYKLANPGQQKEE